MTKYFIIILLFSFPLNVQEKNSNLSQEEIDVLINTHNKWRKEVGVPTLTWSDDLSKIAEKWAKELKKQGCAFKHSKYQYGENLFTGTTGYYNAEYVVNAWGSEKEFYSYKKNKCDKGKMCGHYTQMVWKNTTKVGCAKIICGGMETWVCEYDPPGNYVGKKPY